MGFVREVDVLDADGKPTGKKKPEWDGDGGLAGYLEWAAVYQPGHFIPQLGKVMPIQINAVARTETKPVVHYETVEERRAAMIAKGWRPLHWRRLRRRWSQNSSATCGRRTRGRARL